MEETLFSAKIKRPLADRLRPKTLDEVVEAAKSLTKDTNGDGVTDIYGFNMPADLPWYLNGFFKAAGADIISSPTEVNINQPEVVEVLEAFKQMALDGSMPANQHSTAKDDFGNGTVAMILNSCSSNRTISNAVNGKFNYELVNFPSINGNICAPLGGNGLAVFKSDEKMEQLAWEFVKFMISTNAYCGYTMEKGYIPISKSTMQDEKVQERINDPFWKSTYDQIDDLYGQPINPVDATIWNNLVDIFSLVEENPQSSDIAKLVSDMQKEIDDFLEEY